MKVSLSVRVAESAKRKDIAMVPIEALAPQAAAAGFRALSLRASVVAVDSPSARVEAVRRILDEHALAASLVTGDVALAANTVDATMALRDIGPYLDLADALGARLVRVMAHDAADIARMRRAADTAAERGLIIAHQTHWGTLCETVEDTLQVVRAVSRANFAITIDPANLLACGSPVDAAAVARLAPYAVNVFFQNLCLDRSSAVTFPSRHRGAVGVRYLPLHDASGIDLVGFLGALEEASYAGWFTVHQPLREGQTVAGAIDEAAWVRRAVEDPGRRG